MVVMLRDDGVNRL